jgi:hypothetical protein
MCLNVSGDGVSDDWFSGKVRESVALTRYLVVKNETVVHYEKYMQDLQLPHYAEHSYLLRCDAVSLGYCFPVFQHRVTLTQ